MTNANVVVLLSGGIDSTILLYHLIYERGAKPIALYIRNLDTPREFEIAQRIADMTQTEIRAIDIRSYMAVCTTQRVPGEGEAFVFGNAVMLSMALGFAIKLGIHEVAIGVHKDDVDCYYQAFESEFSEFMDHMSAATRLVQRNCKIIAPFYFLTAAQVVQKGIDISAPLEATWSCITPYNDLQDGICHCCLERRYAFHVAGIKDRTVYANKSSALELAESIS